MRTRVKLITLYQPTPIPDRRFDWRAWWSDDPTDGHHVGWGATDTEAVEDLKRLDDERAECEEANGNA